MAQRFSEMVRRYPSNTILNAKILSERATDNVISLMCVSHFLRTIFDTDYMD